MIAYHEISILVVIHHADSYSDRFPVPKRDLL